MTPGENRARVSRAAMALIEYPLQVGRDKLLGQLSRFVSVRPPVPVPAELRTFVASNSAALKLVDESRGRSQSNWETEPMMGSNLPSLMEIRTLSDIIYLAMRADLDDGRIDEAATSSAAGLALSASLRQEPSILLQLIRMAVGQRHFEGVMLLMIEAEPSKAALEEWARLLAENRTPDPMDVGLLAELRQFNGALRRMEDGELMPNGVAADFMPGTVARMTGARNSPFWPGPLARLPHPLIRMGRVHYLEQMEKLLEIQAGARPRTALPDVPRHWSPFRWLDSTTLPGYRRAMESSDVFNSQLGVTELAVALRRYRIDRGQYPDALSMLVPAYVAVMPLDPVTGKPPEYERQNAGFRLRAETGKDVAPYNATLLDWNVPK